MDKQNGLDILGLAPSATCADAHAAFRRLVKIWHPDRFAKDPLKAQIAEEKMKQINGAFHFLLPLLADADVRRGVGENPLDSGHDCGQACCRKKRSQDFFSFLASGIKKRFNERKWANVQETNKAGQTYKAGPRCQAKPAERALKTQFETMFQNAVNHRQAGGTPPFQSPQSTPVGNALYKKRVTSIPGHPGHMSGKKNWGMGPVEEIRPISSISPVKRHR